jgi:hypothetical protein
MNTDEFLGLTKKAAQDKAEAKNLVFRLIRVGSEPYFPYPTDQRNDRVCIEIDDGKVSKVTLQ